MKTHSRPLTLSVAPAVSAGFVPTTPTSTDVINSATGQSDPSGDTQVLEFNPNGVNTAFAFWNENKLDWVKTYSFLQPWETSTDAVIKIPRNPDGSFDVIQGYSQPVS